MKSSVSREQRDVAMSMRTLASLSSALTDLGIAPIERHENMSITLRAIMGNLWSGPLRHRDSLPRSRLFDSEHKNGARAASAAGSARQQRRQAIDDPRLGAFGQVG